MVRLKTVLRNLRGNKCASTPKGFDEGLQIDYENEYIIGHSSANHITVNYLAQGCGKFLGLVMMSPVDCTGKTCDSHCITPGDLLNFEIPTLVLPAGLDDLPGKKSILIFYCKKK